MFDFPVASVVILFFIRVKSALGVHGGGAAGGTTNRAAWGAGYGSTGGIADTETGTGIGGGVGTTMVAGGGGVTVIGTVTGTGSGADLEVVVLLLGWWVVKGHILA